MVDLECMELVFNTEYIDVLYFVDKLHLLVLQFEEYVGLSVQYP